MDISLLDKKKVQTFIEDNVRDRSYASILSWSSLLKVFVAEEDEQIAGLILSWKSSFHPYCIYFKLIIKNIPEADAIAEQLLSKLAKRDELPLQTSVWESDTHLVEFYEKQNLRLIRKTYMPIAPIESLILKPREPIKYQILSLREAAANQMLKDRLVTFTKQIYEETHKVNPVAAFENETWEPLIFAEDTLMDLSYCVIDAEQEIIAFSYLHKKTINQLELGWLGFSGENEEVLLQLVSWQLEQAAKKGYYYLTGEFDSTSSYAMFIYRNLLLPETKSWNTYQLKNKLQG